MPNNHTTWPFMATVDFLHHENPPTWAGVEPTTLDADGQRQTNYATQSALAEFSYDNTTPLAHADASTDVLPSGDGPTNLEQPTRNHVQSDTIAPAILADPTRALQGTNRGSGLVMEESEKDVGSLEQLLLYADEHYLAGKLPLGDHLGKVLHGVEEYHQRNVGWPVKVPRITTGYHRIWPPRPLHQLCGQCDVEQCGGIVPLTRVPSHPYTVIVCSKTNRDSSLNTTFCQSVTFHIDLAWHHCRRSCRCSGVKGSARKGRLDLTFASERCLQIVCGTIATTTSTRIVERVTVGSTSTCCKILRSSLLVVFLVAPDPVFRT
ncbi:uncharacterized protein TNCV_1154281 [Trichonephila clavipes]|nr:uncharacterized protein TNCV_1154281 [Trichonephila clavipes]